MAVIPALDDADTAGFFQAAADGHLAVRRCGTCDAVLHMPVAYCRFCGGFDGRWVQVAPAGRVYSYTVVTHQVHPDFAVPYTVILVELAELPEVRLIGRLDGRPEVYIGQPVVAEFEPLSDGAALPVWRLRDQHA
jgi:uncharacterized OB-fold protein